MERIVTRLGKKREGAGEDVWDPLPVSPMDSQVPPGREKVRLTWIQLVH